MRNAIDSHTPLRHALSSIQVCKHVSETVEIFGTLPCCVLIVLIFDRLNVVDDCENVSHHPYNSLALCVSSRVSES